ncbi:chromosomal replication initiator protein [Salinibacter ruber]|jgi:chromosomal replication initiator protein|uniref:Chromosomal replication initiator protein DnaA n=3 Tax=Salinibacter ruber TaxID=146919 RepID=Q2S2T8_SALRD|nr:chromosomal replication initiator protein DnaA [Salinibacter ruber]ABC43784.1 chromosomal replication initiator protein DnaA [Salinibacter ruber DSM 13855]MBB4062579.1 chromosomal replication initiator protein [Salinibacter ruber]MBB4068594.1 chromosomal replication initiator protein [Salinibacter ruber]MCS3610822.1 chromosomal replication initiator protein [Salinibacter ruber]MCS3639017.1 chromosomal replication initiator protein [Salinibacter ruber]
MVPSASDAWRTALRDLRETLPERTVQNWLDPIQPLDLSTDEGSPTLTLQVPTPFGIQYLRSRFQRSIRQAVSEAVGEPTDVTYQVAPEEERPDEIATDSGSSGSAPDEPDASSSPQDRPSSAPSSDQAGRSSTSPRPSEPVSSSSPAGREAINQSPSPDASTSGGASSPTGPTTPRPSSPDVADVSDAGRTDDASAPSPPQTDAGSPDERSALYEQAKQHLRPEYTFDEFVEGDGNRLARSAAFAVAQEPGSTNYNPLLVYGGVGLGKTHLAQAVANYALEHNTAERVLYVSSDRFTSQFVQSVRENRIAAFSSYYRQADLLIVDDVQFFGEKEKTQEEFFHIFNDLHQNGKQIFLCADRPPAEIPGIEERLLSRFQWGLSADIQRPDLETRIAILQRKAARQDIAVSPDVLELIAQRIDSNVRQLEGALTRLTALVQLDDRTLDLDTARRFLREHTDEGADALNADDIIEQVAEYFRLEKGDLLSRSRKQTVAQARQIAMYLCRELTDESYDHIGSRFGGRDHSTVIHAYRKIEEDLESDTELQDDISSLQSNLQDRSLSSSL